MSPLRMGVMGCANFAWQSMIPALIECDAVELVAVASRTKDKAQKFSRRFNCDALVGDESLLSRKDIEAIYIPLPTGLHEEWVVKALEARKHLLVEKSFAENFASAKKMTDLDCLKKCLVMENFLFPHHSEHNWVTEKIRKSELGVIHFLGLMLCVVTLHLGYVLLEPLPLHLVGHPTKCQLHHAFNLKVQCVKFLLGT